VNVHFRVLVLLLVSKGLRPVWLRSWWKIGHDDETGANCACDELPINAAESANAAIPRIAIAPNLARPAARLAARLLISCLGRSIWLL